MQKCVRHAGEPRLGLLGVGEHGFTAYVPGRCDQRTGKIIQDQMMQRAVGQKDTDFIEPGGHILRQ